jgi:hypothetical protein
MPSSDRSLFYAVCRIAFCAAFVVSFTGGIRCAWSQEMPGTTGRSRAAEGERSDGNPLYRHDNLDSNWSRRGRSVPGQSAAKLRLRAYQAKIAMRAARAAEFRTRSVISGTSGQASSPAFWSPLGPAPLASDATGSGIQDYNWVSGRATSVLIDPADATGNTVLLGGAYGGLWKSTNAGSLSSSPSTVTWQPLIDDQPTLAVGAIALQPVAPGGSSNVILVGTGETNNSGDSYYGLGILRSANAGSTWTPITGAASGQSFLGVGFSKIAFSSAQPNIVVAATAGDNGLDLGLEEDANSTARGLYFSINAGVTWNRVLLSDNAVPASVSSVVYNPSQGTLGTFYAFIRRHGLYSSTDGQHFTRLALQPTAGLASGSCPATSNSNTCLVYRGEIALVPGRDEMYVWVVDVQFDVSGNPSPVDEGIVRSLNGGTNWVPIPDNGITNCGDNAFGADSGCGVEQGFYNLALAAIPSGTSATDLYAGAINLYKCTIAGGTTCLQGDWINLTHVYGCDPGPLGAPAHVHPDQHAIAFMVASGKSPGYFAHDGGISRTLDGYSGLNSGTCSGTNRFDSLSQTLGSMTEFISFSVHPTNPNILLGGTQDNGSPKTSTATNSTSWQNALGGDGGFNAISPSNPSEWYAASPYLNILKCTSGTACNDNDFFEIVSPSNLGGDQGAFYTPYILDPQNTGELLVGTCRVWRVGTSGTAPLPLSDDFDTLGTGVCTGGETNLVNAIAAGGPVYFNHSSVVYAVTNGYGPLSVNPGGEVWVTTNAGVTSMTNVTGTVNPQGYAIAAVTIDTSDVSGNTAYIGIMGFSTLAHPTSHIWKTSNAGTTWVDWTGTGSTALPNSPVNALLVDSQAALVYAASDVGVFVSATASPGWTETGPLPGPTTSGFLPDAPVTALQIFNDNAGTKNLLASTYGRGIWNFPLAPNYANVVTNSPQTIFIGQTAAFRGTLNAEVGYASLVNLSCSNELPTLASCTVSPAQANLAVTPTEPYNVNASGSVGDYSFNVHAVGTDSHTLRHDVPVTLHIVDFNLTAPSPNSIVVAQGATSPGSTFQVTASGIFAEPVTLSCSGLPSGTACQFFPAASVSPTAANPVTVTLTVTATSGTALGGPTTITVAGTASGAPSAKTETFGLKVTVPVPDFAIAVTPAPATTGINQNVSWNGTVTSIDGYSGTVALSCTAGAPAMCTRNPQTLRPTAAGVPFTVTLGSASAAVFNFTIKVTDGTITHATPTETLTVTGSGANIIWTDTGSPNVTVLAGQNASYTFSATPVGGVNFTSAVNFACNNLPVLTSCTFNPASITAGSAARTVTLSVSSTGPNFGTHSSIGRTNAKEATSVEDLRGKRGLPHSLPLFTFGWVVVAGILGAGRKRCSRKKPRVFLLAVCLALGVMAELSCGGLSSSNSTTSPPPVTVTVNPGLATLFADEPGNSWPLTVIQQQLAATVNGSSNQSVTWSVPGGAANGTIDANGLYTTPASVPNPATVTVVATSPLASSPASTFVTVSPATALGTSQVTVVATPVGGSPHADIVTLTVQ